MQGLQEVCQVVKQSLQQGLQTIETRLIQQIQALVCRQANTNTLLRDYLRNSGLPSILPHPKLCMGDYDSFWCAGRNHPESSQLLSLAQT
jgi:hypothetical protein